jgi:hypothetical protein
MGTLQLFGRHRGIRCKVGHQSFDQLLVIVCWQRIGHPYSMPVVRSVDLMERSGTWDPFLQIFLPRGSGIGRLRVKSLVRRSNKDRFSMSVVTTAVQDVDLHVKASILNTLTEHLAMDRAQVARCLDNSREEDDMKITSRVAIVVIARAQKVFGIKDLVDPKKLQPERVTSVRNVADLLITKLRESIG